MQKKFEIKTRHDKDEAAILNEISDKAPTPRFK